MRWATRAISLVSTLILARLLVPHDFGVIAKASIVYEILNLITSVGLESPLITNPRATRDDYNTVWTIHVLRGLLICAVLVVSAGPIATLLAEPALVDVVPVYGLVALLLGFMNIGTVDFLKHFRFDKDFQLTLWRKVIAFAATITAAILMKNYWAFVIGSVVDALVAVAASFAMTRHRVQFTLSQWRSFLRYGSQMLGFEVISAFSAKLDGLLLSRFESTGTLGVYSISHDLGVMPSTELAMPVARAVMPGLARFPDDARRFQDLYLASIALVLSIAVPAACAVSVLAETIVDIALGEAWSDAAPLLQALALFGATRAIGSLSGAAYLSRNRSDLLLQISTLNLLSRAVFLSAGLYLGGVVGLAWACVGVGASSALGSWYIQARAGLLAGADLARSIWRTVVSSMVMIVALYAIDRHLLADVPQIPRLIVDAAAGLTIYLLVHFALWHITRRSSHGPEPVAIAYARTVWIGLGQGRQ